MKHREMITWIQIIDVRASRYKINPPCCVQIGQTVQSRQTDCGPSTRRSTVGDRAFPVAASRVWNSLPLTVTSLHSLPVFKRQLKTVLFARCYDC